MRRVRQGSLILIEVAFVDADPLLQLSLTGTTFIASSGDGGVAFYGTLLDACLVANGPLVENDPPNSTFVSGFPATCPYVTSVGATAVASGNGVRLPSRLSSTDD